MIQGLLKALAVSGIEMVFESELSETYSPIFQILYFNHRWNILRNTFFFNYPKYMIKYFKFYSLPVIYSQKKNQQMCALIFNCFNLIGNVLKKLHIKNSMCASIFNLGRKILHPKIFFCSCLKCILKYFKLYSFPDIHSLKNKFSKCVLQFFIVSPPW